MKKVEKILIRKEKKETVDGRERVLVKQKVHYVYDSSKDYSTDKGTIRKEELGAEDGSVIKTTKGDEYVMFSPSFIDIYNKMKRGAQIIPLKDIGCIIATTGLDGNSKVLDAGSGSGALAIMLGNTAKEVVTYEIREDHHKIVKDNIEMFGVKNVKAKLGNIYEGVEENGFDVVTLDLPEPWKAIETVDKVLKVGGFLCVYNPSMIQISDFVNSVNENGNFIVLKVVEIIERFWEVSGRKVRPKTEGIGHSGFMVFCRKIS